MKQLLEQWAIAEPERCMTPPKDSSNWLVVPHAIHGDLIGTPHGDALLQHAVQRAIEARGWIARVRILDVVGWNYAAEVIVRFNDSSSTRCMKAGSDKSPAKALLSAYLEALRSIVVDDDPDEEEARPDKMEVTQ